MSDNARTSTIAVQTEYYDDKTRTTNMGFNVEYAFPAISTVAVQIEYQQGVPLLAVGQYFKEEE